MLAVVTFAVVCLGAILGGYRVVMVVGQSPDALKSPGQTMVAAAPDGAKLYAVGCAGCHGDRAQGAVGPGLSAAGGWSAGDFTSAVLDGKAPGGRTLAPMMPRFRGGVGGQEVGDVEMQALLEYVRGL